MDLDTDGEPVREDLRQAAPTDVVLLPTDGTAEAWLPLFAPRTAYQLVATPRWNTTGQARIVTDSHSGATAGSACK